MENPTYTFKETNLENRELKIEVWGVGAHGRKSGAWFVKFISLKGIL